MTTRVLPPAEWHRLAGTLLESAWPTFDPARTVVTVIERDDAIVACFADLLVRHIEGAWIAPALRKRVSVGRRLLKAIRAAAHGEEVVMMAISDEMRAICPRLGTVTHLACDHFAVRM